MKPVVRNLFAFVIATALMAPHALSAAEMPELYFVDAHSQLPRGQDPDEIIELMDKAGVWRTILSARNDRKPEDVAALATAHPDRITAAVRSKGKAFNKNTGKFPKLIHQQVSQPVFAALGEAILFHAQKGKKAPKIEVAIDSPQSQLLLDIALEKNWPYIAHYEFAAAGWDKSDYMAAFEKMVAAHPNHPFVLIHMGQLGSDDAKRLLAVHTNVYFITSHSNPVTIAKNSGQPWARLYEGKSIAPKWAELMRAYPDRFVLGFDNVWPEDWGRTYLKQAEMWRAALGELSPDLAHAIAHGNAERLWNLTPR